MDPQKPAMTRLDRKIFEWFPRWGWNRFRHRALEFAYRATSQDRKRRTVATTGGTGDEQATEWDLWSLREQSRALDRDNVLAEGVLNRAVDNIVGVGFAPQAQTDDEGWNTEAEAAFNEWARRDCDVRGVHSLWNMTRLALRSRFNDGDIGFIMLEDSLQAIEADWIATPADQMSNQNITNGIKMDAVGKPISFFVGEARQKYAAHGYYLMGKDYVEVPSKNFIHHFNPKRFTQTRGVPVFAAAMPLFTQLDSYIEASIVKRQVAAMLTAFIAQEGAAAQLYGQTETETDAAGKDYELEKLKTGTIFRGRPNEKVYTISGIADDEFQAFMGQMLRFIGLSLGLPLELAMMDVSETTYGSARVALLQAQVSFRIQQQLLIDQFLNRVWSWRIGRLIQQGKLSQIDKALRVEWSKPGWKWIDPEAESTANAEALAHSMNTLKDIAAEQGKDWENLMIQRAVELKRAAEVAKEYGVDPQLLIDATVKQQPKQEGTKDANAKQA